MARIRSECSEKNALALGGAEYVKVWKKLPRCEDCGRPMRPHRSRLGDWPATTGPASPGYCAADYQIRLDHKSLPNRYKAPVPVAEPTSLKQIAREWDELQHAVAFTIADRVSDPAEARELMHMLGLFETGPALSVTWLSSPQPEGRSSAPLPPSHYR